MNEDLSNLQCIPIFDYNYSEWFEEFRFEGRMLSDKERGELVAAIDEDIDLYTAGFPSIYEAIENCKGYNGAFFELDRTVSSAILFVLMTMIDSMVAVKYFALADRDYERRFMRGKLFIILNEGFKKLYGYEENTYKKSEWHRLSLQMQYFPDEIQQQFQKLTPLLETHSKSSSWWRDERNAETHLLIEQLYASRQKEIIDGEVIMDSMKLYKTLRAVSLFLFNAHACVTNSLISDYQNRRGETNNI